MSRGGETTRADAPGRGPVRRLARGVLGLAWRTVALAALALVVLTLVGAAITPVSTLMLGRWATMQPVTRMVAPLETISAHVPRMVIASEDSLYCRHAGVDFDALLAVIEAGAERGASTISMQTAKNVFLWPQRSYVRKAIEIPLALWLDLVWGKRRTLEVYLNVAEWGDGIFGVEAAARAHFGKSAADLTRREAALLATALPNPRGRDPGRPSGGHARLAENLMARERGSGDIFGCLD
ncbi:transglycosylase domain-containing protein [Salinarimonas rosea]|uniref:transglycosylase domain-containing protein n=1 Tax=Salinarimonas rosea TaxID=552063 RepID=UPI00040379DF|nr:transglycosylase domain-containing protein [Salinarimonas rosea]